MEVGSVAGYFPTYNRNEFDVSDRVGGRGSNIINRRVPRTSSDQRSEETGTVRLNLSFKCFLKYFREKSRFEIVRKLFKLFGSAAGFFSIVIITAERRWRGQTEMVVLLNIE